MNVGVDASDMPIRGGGSDSAEGAYFAGTSVDLTRTQKATLHCQLTETSLVPLALSGAE